MDPYKLHSCFSVLQIFLIARSVDLLFGIGTGTDLRKRLRTDCSRGLPVSDLSIG